MKHIEIMWLHPNNGSDHHDYFPIYAKLYINVNLKVYMYKIRDLGYQQNSCNFKQLWCFHLSRDKTKSKVLENLSSENDSHDQTGPYNCNLVGSVLPSKQINRVWYGLYIIISIEVNILVHFIFELNQFSNKMIIILFIWRLFEWFTTKS